jgi:hypothetical protein
MTIEEANVTVKVKETRSASVAEAIPQRMASSKGGLQLADHRRAALVQRKLHETANQSRQVRQLKHLQTLADRHGIETAQLRHSSPVNSPPRPAHASRPNKTGLPAQLKAGIEGLSGFAMDDVKVHYNSSKPAQLHAHAYAQGSDIHIAAGQEKHLPHEAWHVAQQKQGRVVPTTQMKGAININDDAHLEHEADVMGSKAASGMLQAKSAPGNQGAASRQVYQAVKLTPDQASQTNQLGGGKDDKQDIPASKDFSLVQTYRRYAHPVGTTLNFAGFTMLCMLARKPRYAKMSFKVFDRQLLMDFVKFKGSLLSIVVGNHMMGADSLISASTSGTRYDMRPHVSAGQDKFNWSTGAALLAIGGIAGIRAFIMKQGLGKFPIKNLGYLPPAVLTYFALSSGTKLMGKEGTMAEIVRIRRGQERQSEIHPHSKSKEKINDLISQILFMGAMALLHKGAFASKMPFFDRRRMMGLAGAGLYTASNLSAVSSTLPLLAGKKPEQIDFNPRENPLDVSRSLIGLGSAGMGVYYIIKSMNKADRIKFFARMRMGMFGATSLFGGLNMLQLRPIIYMLYGKNKKNE